MNIMVKTDTPAIQIIHMRIQQQRRKNELFHSKRYFLLLIAVCALFVSSYIFFAHFIASVVVCLLCDPILIISPTILQFYFFFVFQPLQPSDRTRSRLIFLHLFVACFNCFGHTLNLYAFFWGYQPFGRFYRIFQTDFNMFIIIGERKAKYWLIATACFRCQREKKRKWLDSGRSPCYTVSVVK